MIKFIIKKVLFLFLLLLLSNWGPCERKEELDSRPLNVKILEKKLSETDQKENQINEMIEKIKGNLNFLSGKEKDILKILFHSNLKADPIQFDIENIKIHFSKRGNYNPNYYIKQFKENPEMEKNILLATQQIIRNILLTTLQKNNPQKGSQNQITLPIRLSELFELRKYLVLASEEKIDDQLLAPENLNTNLDIQNGTLDILIKKTLFTNFIHQKIHPAFLSKGNKSNQDHIYTLAINKANLPKTLQNNLEKLIPSNIKDNKEIGEKIEPTYANLFHHLLNNKKQLVETIYNEIYPSEKIPKIRDIKGTLATDSPFEIITNTQQQNDEIAADKILKQDFSKANLVKDSNNNRLTLSYTDPKLSQDVFNIILQDIATIPNPVSGSTKIQDALACFQNAIQNAIKGSKCDYKATLKLINPALSADIDIIRIITYIYDTNTKRISFNFDLKISADIADDIQKKDFSPTDLVKSSSNRLTLSYTDPNLSQDVFNILLQDIATIPNPVSGSTKIQDALACIQNAIKGGTCDYKATLEAIHKNLSVDINNIKTVNTITYDASNKKFSVNFDLKSPDEIDAEKILKKNFSTADLVSSNNALTLSYTDPSLSSNTLKIIQQEIANTPNPVAGSTKIQDALACIQNAIKGGTCDYKATLKAIHPNLSTDIDNIKKFNYVNYNQNILSYTWNLKTAYEIADDIQKKDFSTADLVKDSNNNRLTLSHTDPNLTSNTLKIIKQEIANTPNPVSGSTKIQDALACIQNARNSGTCDYKATLKAIDPTLSTDIDNIKTVNTTIITYDANNNRISVDFNLKTAYEIADDIQKKDFSTADLVKDSNNNRLTLSHTDPNLTSNTLKIIKQEIANTPNPVSGSTKIQDALACIQNARNSGTCDYKATLKAIDPTLSTDIDNIKTVNTTIITYDANNNRISVDFNLKTTDEITAEKILNTDFSKANLVKDINNNRLTLSHTDPSLSSNTLKIIQQEIAKTQNPVAGSTKIQDALGCIQNAINSGTCDYKATLKAIDPTLSTDIDNIKTVNPITYDANNNRISVDFDLKTTAEITAEIDAKDILNKDFSAANLKIDQELVYLNNQAIGLTLTYTDSKLTQDVWNIIEQEINNIQSPVSGNKNIRQTLACIRSIFSKTSSCNFRASLKAIDPTPSTIINKITTLKSISYNNNSFSVIFRF